MQQKKHLVKFKTAINATPKMILHQYVLQMQLHIRLGVIHKLRWQEEVGR